MKEKLSKIMDEALSQIEASGELEKLNDIRVAFLGKKGELTSVLKGMKDVAPEDRPKVGQLVNEARTKIEAKLEEKKETFEKKLLEEKLLKKNNVNHAIINMLRNYDWNDFKRERSFRTHQNVTKDVFFDLKATVDKKEIYSIDDLMDEIENEHLYNILLNEDNITLKIIMYKVQGYSTKEIANILGITIDNIYYRIKKLRKKIK